ncbi:MAG: hypothetical protein A2V88_10460 [Elusimicrobia bacterium RBG_16_66_12]|nr:MAG: hypothetical protein A2V88_10460 [Elusimicrobia bacterium RBG_16_66_12]
MRPTFVFLCLVGTLFFSRREAPSSNEFYVATSYVDLGEALVHRVPLAEDVSHRLPFSTILTAWLSNHRHIPPESARMFLRALVLLLSLACGSLFLSAGAPLFSAVFSLLVLWIPVVPFYGAFQELFFSTLTLTLAGLLAWRSQNPSMPRTILVSLCLGMSLTFRSVFAFFPPFLLLLEFIQDRRNFRRRWKQAVVLCVLPYLWLIPWIKMNWGLHHRFVAFEHQGADMNIVAGALGLVQGFSINCKEFVGDGPVLAWAVREVWSHPIRYVEGFFRRLAFALSLQPWLFVFGIVSAWVYRKRPECRALFLLAGYILVLYCSMAVVPRYFEPLWPLLAVLAAALPARLLEKDSPQAQSRESRLAPGILLSWPALLLIPTFFAEAAGWSHPAIDPSDSVSKAKAFDAAILRRPGEAWLWAARGKDELRGGKLAAASSSFAQAVRLAPDDRGYALDAAWARALQGFPESLFAWPSIPEGPSTPTARGINLKARLYKAVACLRSGRRSQARRHLQAFIKTHRSQTVIAGLETDRGDAVIRTIVASDKGLKDMIDGLMRARPVSERLLLLNAISELGPRFDLRAEQAELLRGRVEQQMRLNKKDEALRSLAKAEELPMTAQEFHLISLNYQDLHQYERQCRVLHRLIKDHPREAVFWSDLGICLYRRGSRAPAIGALRTAIRIDARFLPPYASLGAIYTAEGRSQEALELYDQALRFAAKGDRLLAAVENSRNILRSQVLR